MLRRAWMRWAPLASLALITLGSGRLQADAGGRVIHPWEDLARGFYGSYTWPGIALHAAAVALTPPLVYEFDAPVQGYFQAIDPIGQGFADTTLAVGWVAPVVVPAAFYLGGLIGGADELATAGAAALQAVVVQAIFVSALKWLTDRAGPYPNGDARNARWSKGLFRDSNDPKDFDFNPFDIKGGLRWPSGHTASNIALVSALVAFYPDQPWIAAVGYSAVLAIALGMLEGDYHWFSDVVAGALMGHAIGWAIGKHFRARYDAARGGAGSAAARSGRPDRELGWSLQPNASPFGAGLSLVYRTL